MGGGWLTIVSILEKNDYIWYTMELSCAECAVEICSDIW